MNFIGSGFIAIIVYAVNTTPAIGNFILAENGSIITTEDGNGLITES